MSGPGNPFTYAYGGTRTFGYLASAGGLSVVLVYLAVNLAVIRAFRTEFRDQFRLVRHLLIPAAAVVVLRPAVGDHPPAGLHPGEPAALHRTWLAQPRRHRGRCPSDAATYQL